MVKPNSLGLTRRDIRRIQMMAEAMTDTWVPPALADLDVPIRVAVTAKGQEGRLSGEVLGEWAGRVLLYWRMTNRERETWARRRAGD